MMKRVLVYVAHLSRGARRGCRASELGVAEHRCGAHYAGRERPEQHRREQNRKPEDRQFSVLSSGER